MERDLAKAKDSQPPRQHLHTKTKRFRQRHLAPTAGVDIGVKIAGSTRVIKLVKAVAKAVASPPLKARAKAKMQIQTCAFAAEEQNTWPKTAKFPFTAWMSKT